MVKRKKVLPCFSILIILLGLLIPVNHVPENKVFASEAENNAGESSWKDQWINNDWKAKWIWDSEKSNPNTWMIFRKSLEIDRVPKKAITKIAVDSKYWLWINGQLVVFEGGLKRGPSPEDTYYDEVDIAPYLNSGNNTIAVLAQYWGKDGFSHKSSGKAGFIFESSINGGLIISDNTWKVKQHSAYKNHPDNPNYRLSESHVYFDARVELGQWYLNEFNDSEWGKAVELGGVPSEPWNNLWKRPIPLWKDFGLKDFVNNESFPKVSDGTVLKARLPYNAQFTPYLKVKATAGKVIEMIPDSYYVPNGPAIKASYVTKEGIQEYESFGWFNGQEVSFHIPEGVEILSLQFRETGYKTEFAGSFSSNDEFYNKLWEKSLRTLYITMRDNYMDTPDRERAQWWGDAVNEMEMAFYSLDPKSYLLGEKGISNVVEWRSPEGAYPTISPYGLNFFELPAQAMAGVTSFWTHYEYTGNKELMEYVYPSVKQYLGLYEFDGEGVVIHRPGTWDWSDWGSNIDQRLITNAWYYISLQSAVNLAKLTGNEEDVPGYELKMAMIQRNFDRVFWNGNEYRSPNYTGKTDDRGNALAVIAGLVDQSQYAKVKNVLGKQFHASPYMEKYVLEALFEMGYEQDALTRMKSRYTNMVREPYSTLWEFWDTGSGTKNHAWSGGPLTLLSKYVAGVSPIEPGYEKYQIIPQLGNLNDVNAVVPTLKGDIGVGIKKTADTEIVMTVNSPGDTEARIGIPRYGESNTIIYAGDQVVWEDGRFTGEVTGLKYYSNDSNYIYVTAAPGTWNFSSKVKQPDPNASQFLLSIDRAEGGKVKVDGEEVAIPLKKTFAKGTEVKLEAVPDQNKTFVHWDGSIANTSNPLTVTMDSAKTINANFTAVKEEAYTELVIHNEPDFSGVIKVDDEIFNLPYRGLFEKGKNATLEAISKDGMQYQFSHWNNDPNNTKNPLSVTLDKDVELTANFKDLMPNLALHKQVNTVRSLEAGKTWSKNNLTDGLTAVSGGVNGFTTDVFPSTDISKDPHWIEIDLGQNMDINTLRLYPRTDAFARDQQTPNFPVDFTIDVKPENGQFSTVKEVKNQPNPKGKVQTYEFETQTARFIRVKTTKLGLPAIDEGFQNAFRIQLAEISVHKQLPNLAFNKQAKTNNSLESLPSWSVNNLTDGQKESNVAVKGFTTDTYPSRDVSSNPHWIEIDLGKEQYLNLIRLFPRTDAFALNELTANFPVDFKIQLKGETGDYQTVKEVEGQENPKGIVQSYEFERQNARYIRIQTTKLGLPAADEGISNPFRIQLAEISVHYVDQTPPTTTLSVDKLEINGWFQSDVKVTLSAEDDATTVTKIEYQINNGDWHEYKEPVTFTEEGKHTFNYRSVDKEGNVEEVKTKSVNIDKSKPQLEIKLDKTVLSPPNHMLIPINLTIQAKDDVSGISSVKLISVTSNEPDNGLGDGDTDKDIQEAEYGTEDTAFSLRAERSGKGSGRVYTITYKAIDQAGNETTVTGEVLVPKSN
ncbi:discoidin domain-containing protein [Neobacillus sp. FSL H8-0543]|uniref:alpha-L-rhamnosidase-related protein n=1 Tax=Neobacillus sp. FSL H8-0543 TaxID=2954672 RepID=UPI003158933A